MKRFFCRRLREQRGMTLLEVLVTLGALTIFMAGTLQFYSTSYKNISLHEASLGLTHDAHGIMSLLAEDIRQAEAFVPEFPKNATRTVVAALRMAPKIAGNGQEIVVVYSLDDRQPAHLFRTVFKGREESSLELSSVVQSLHITPDDNHLVRVELILEKNVAGQQKTFKASSAYAMRF